jgi:hypothetical protein
MLNKVQPAHIIGQGAASTQNEEGQGTAHIFGQGTALRRVASYSHTN